ncbi:MAG TPA: ComF family protein [Anaerolineaceae bacterium]
MTAAGAQLRPMSVIYHWFWQVIDLIYPPDCSGCQKPGLRWCTDCAGKVEPLQETLCPICGVPQTQPQVCAQCISNPPACDQIRSYARYTGPLRQAILRLKYKRDLGIGEILAEYLVRQYRLTGWDIDAIVPVPLSHARYHERGYNQVSQFSFPFAWAISKPYLPGALMRTRNTTSQVGLSGQQRRMNVIGAFSACQRKVMGKRILVIDDVTTTGATLDACAKALKDSGAKIVYGLTLARAGLVVDNDNDFPST